MELEAFEGLIFCAIQNRIKEEVPEIRWIDQDLGQLEYYEIRPAVSFPCLLIDFPTSQGDDHGENAQWVKQNIELRLAFAPFSQSSNTAPDAVKAKALEFWELERKVYKALQGWTATDEDGEELGQPFSRRSAATEKRDDSIRVRSLTYATEYEDRTAQPARTPHAATPEFDLEDE